MRVKTKHQYPFIIVNRASQQTETEIMAKYPESSNPFLDDDDEDDGFSSPYSSKSHSNQRYGGPSDRMSQKQEMISASEDRQLESSRRALASLYESERMGVATGEVYIIYMYNVEMITIELCLIDLSCKKY